MWRSLFVWLNEDHKSTRNESEQRLEVYQRISNNADCLRKMVPSLLNKDQKEHTPTDVSGHLAL